MQIRMVSIGVMVMMSGCNTHAADLSDKRVDPLGIIEFLKKNKNIPHVEMTNEIAQRWTVGSPANKFATNLKNILKKNEKERPRIIADIELFFSKPLTWPRVDAYTHKKESVKNFVHELGGYMLDNPHMIATGALEKESKENKQKHVMQAIEKLPIAQPVIEKILPSHRGIENPRIKEQIKKMNARIRNVILDYLSKKNDRERGLLIGQQDWFNIEMIQEPVMKLLMDIDKHRERTDKYRGVRGGWRYHPEDYFDGIRIALRDYLLTNEELNDNSIIDDSALLPIEVSAEIREDMINLQRAIQAYFLSLE